jgi:hypothetical protein
LLSCGYAVALKLVGDIFKLILHYVVVTRVCYALARYTTFPSCFAISTEAIAIVVGMRSDYLNVNLKQSLDSIDKIHFSYLIFLSRF